MDFAPAVFNFAVRHIAAIDSKDFPTKASRPRNSRLDMTRLEQVYNIKMPNWREALDLELDQLSWPAQS